jgi:hypothetical protein
MGIPIQPAAASGITATNNHTADHPATPSTSNCIPCNRSSTASRQSLGYGKSEGKTKISSNKERGSVLKTIDHIASFKTGALDGGNSVGQFAVMMMQQQSQAQMQAQIQQQQQQFQQFQLMQQLQLQPFQQSMHMHSQIDVMD